VSMPLFLYVLVMKIPSFTLRNSISLSFSAFILFSTYLMVCIVYPYTTWKWDVDFLMTKQFIIHLDHYRAAFYTHIFSSVIVLFCGAFLFSAFILNRFSALHRSFGKLYVVLILFLSAPSGLVMAFYANGGLWVKISFLILTPLWWFFTYRGYTSIRKGKVNDHKTWMIRSYALTLSAISLRTYQLVLGHINLMNPEYHYLFVSWISWVGNFAIAEIYIHISKLRSILRRRNKLYYHLHTPKQTIGTS